MHGSNVCICDCNAKLLKVIFANFHCSKRHFQGVNCLRISEQHIGIPMAMIFPGRLLNHDTFCIVENLSYTSRKHGIGRTNNLWIAPIWRGLKCVSFVDWKWSLHTTVKSLTLDIGPLLMINLSILFPRPLKRSLVVYCFKLRLPFYYLPLDKLMKPSVAIALLPTQHTYQMSMCLPQKNEYHLSRRFTNNLTLFSIKWVVNQFFLMFE